MCAAELSAAGDDFVSFGTNDLTRHTLAVDRNNDTVTDRYDALHPAGVRLIRETIETCRYQGVSTSICGQAALTPKMIQELVDAGITSISVNTHLETKRVEQRLIFKAVRE